ncbi:MAG: N-6 DNA methylase [Polyangiaceae bacterium]
MSQLLLPTVEEADVQPAPRDEANAGQSYLESLPRATRRAHGRVYTPEHLVSFILDLAGYRVDAALDRISLLDPACGAGAFLVGSLVRLAQHFRRRGVPITTSRGATRFLRAVERNLFGVDMDAEACALARGAVQTMTANLIHPQLVPSEFFVANVHHEDFLSVDEADAPSVDFIVGNPPYVPTTRLSAPVKNDYRQRFRTANGRIDLYVLFFERGLERLGENGTLAFITPNKVLTTASAAPLRDLLRDQAHIRTIAEFSSHKVFPEAATIPCITVIERNESKPSQHEVEYYRCISSEEQVRVTHRSRHRLPEGEWRLSEPEVTRLVEALRNRHRPLSDRVARISAGIATGRDSIYVLPTSQAEKLGLERALRHPAIRGKDVGVETIAASNLDIIVPYIDDEHGTPKLVDLEDFPNVARYLAKNRQELGKRHCVRTWKKAWYDLHDPWKTNIAAHTKILVPDVAFSNRFAMDDEKRCPLHSCYFLVPNVDEDVAYLTAVLNSVPIEFCVRATAPVVKDGFVRYRKQFLAPLPIPEATALQRKRFVGARNRRKATMDLFGLSSEDMEAMEAFIERSRTSHLDA